MTSSDLTRVGAEKFVSLTTFRRSGEPVSAPVWVARHGEELVVTTVDGTGKVKRLRRDDRVELVPCSRRGTVSPDAAPVSGTARIEDRPAEVEALTQVIRAKYRLEYRIVMLAERLFSRGERPRVILRITLS